MQTITLADGLDLRQSGVYELEAPAVTGACRDNLISKAFTAVRRLAPEIPLVHVALEKNIPQGAGLGGGSADAAAILRWAEMLSPQCRAEDAAAGLGMDVPFLMRGGTAIAGGYGEKVRFLEPLPPWGVILAFPAIPASTAAVYRAFDLSDPAGAGEARLDAVLEDLRAGRVPSALFNGLERAAQAAVPALESFKRKLQELSQMPWFLSGSGSVYYSLNMDSLFLAQIANTLRSCGIPWVCVSQFSGQGSGRRPAKMAEGR
jgi:4-diphosphocytidyl-2-C-methyl-D-erythritol kinase